MKPTWDAKPKDTRQPYPPLKRILGGSGARSAEPGVGCILMECRTTNYKSSWRGERHW